MGLVCAALVACSVNAADYTWRLPVGGYWGDNMNWTPAIVPGEADVAYFTTNGAAGSYTVTLTNAVTVNRLVNDVNRPANTTAFTLDLNGNNFTITNRVLDGAKLSYYTGADIFITNSSGTTATFEGQTLNFGYYTTNAANLTLSGSNLVMSLTSGVQSLVFQAGRGTLTLNKGAKMIETSSLLLGRSASLTGESRIFLVTDPGTLLNVSGSQLNIGKSSGGTMPILIVSNGASYVGSGANKIYLGAGGDNNGALLNNDTNANGCLIVTGSGSKATVATDLSLGEVAGNVAKTAGGFLAITDGGAVTATGVVAIGRGSLTGASWTNTYAYGNVIVSNASSALNIRGASFKIGELGSGYGDVVVADNAKISVTNNGSALISVYDRSTLTVSDALVEGRALRAYSNSTLRIELGARDHTDAYVQLTGALTLEDHVTLDLSVADDFSATYGDTIWLITVGSYAGTGVFANRTDGDLIHIGDFDFEYQQWNDGTPRIVLSVIPEPGTLGLIGAGLGLAALIRRRRQG